VVLGCISEIPVDPQAAFSTRILEAGLSSEDPWAGAHLLLAFAASDPLVEVRQRWRSLIEDPTLSIPLHGEADERGEQHPHLLLRTAAWVLPSTHAALAIRIEKALATTRSPTHWKEINDLAWLIEAAAVLKLDATTATADADLAGLARTLLAALESSDRIVQSCLDEGRVRPDGAADPSVSGTWAYTCGGFHLLSALVESVEAGYLGASDGQRVIDRVLLLTQRIPWELQFRRAEEERAVAAGISARRAARHSVLARMKLVGHGLDVLGRCRIVGLLTPEQSQEVAATCLVAANQIMTRLVEDVDPTGLLLSRQTAITDPLVWERAFGDGCHLIRGLAVWHSSETK
jgi:hypothetical protein